MPILLILFAAVLIFLFCCVGYRKGDDQIHETWLEKIPYELVLTFSAVATLVCMQCLTQVYNSTYNSMSGINFNLTVMCTILFLMLSGLSILVSMTTLAVRIKAHAFWKSTLVGKFCGLIGTWLAAISIVPRTALIAGIILVFMMFLLATDEFGLSLIADIIIAAFLIYRASQAKKVKDITHELALGNLDTPIDSAKLAGIYKEQAEDLNSIGDGMRKAVEQQMKSEHLKTELITNVSHDIKTPLTSVINYVDLLQKPHTEEEGKNYLEVLDRQARRLKKLSEAVVEASKASSGNISAELTPINVHEILEQSLAEYEDRLTAGKLTTITEVKDDPIYVMADGRLLWRVLSNLFSNLCKYALPDTRVYLTAQRVSNDMVEITVKNISRDPLNISKDELMQRFVRGDASRHTEGSGLGLSIAESLTQIMKGHFSIDIDGDLFKASVLLPQTSPLQIPTVEAETPDPDVPSAPAEEIHQETAEPVKTVSAEITDKTEKQAADSNKQ